MVKDKTIAENFFKRDGRLNRMRYFKRNLVIGLAVGAVTFFITLIFNDGAEKLTNFGNVIYSIILLLALIPSYCLMVRRLHDMDRDELLAKVYVGGCVANYFLNLVKYEFKPLSIVLLICSLYILFAPGTRGANQYGADPLE